MAVGSSFPLSTPATVDLVTESGGNLGSLATSLNLAPGSYSQVRLIPRGRHSPPDELGADGRRALHTEADYVDSAGTTHQLPLELLNPDRASASRARSRCR